MKEKLITLWERKERYIENSPELADRKTFFSQAFGALEMALAALDNWDAEDELIALWNDEWKARLEAKVYATLNLCSYELRILLPQRGRKVSPLPLR
jgi:hypothetical protein